MFILSTIFFITNFIINYQLPINLLPILIPITNTNYQFITNYQYKLSITNTNYQFITNYQYKLPTYYLLPILLPINYRFFIANYQLPLLSKINVLNKFNIVDFFISLRGIENLHRILLLAGLKKFLILT